jgi:hypothetical protein
MAGQPPPDPPLAAQGAGAAEPAARAAPAAGALRPVLALQLAAPAVTLRLTALVEAGPGWPALDPERPGLRASARGLAVALALEDGVLDLRCGAVLAS